MAQPTARNSARLRDIDWTGLESYAESDFRELNQLDRVAWTEELTSHREFLNRFGDHLPTELMAQHEELQKRIHDA